MKHLFAVAVGALLGYLSAPHFNESVCSVQKEQIRTRLDACLIVAIQATETAQRCSETLLQGLGLKNEESSCGD
jgi:hypothetical protein